MFKDTIIDKLAYYDNPQFKFDPIKHKYTLDGEGFISVTQFISRFHKKFDSDFWSKVKAEEAGVDQEKILMDWKIINDRSNEIGTGTHAWIENYFNRIYQEIPNDMDIVDRINKFNIIFAKQLYKLIPVKFEQRIFSSKWKIAGMIDSIFIYNDTIIIVDWKSNKKFTVDNTYGEKLLYPFDNFDKCHLSEYSIQISLYALILSEIGIDVKYGILLHIGPDTEAKMYKCYDFKDKLSDYLTELENLHTIIN